LNAYAEELSELIDAVTADYKGPLGWPLFRVGRLVVTPSAKEELTKGDIVRGVVAHGFGDWGIARESEREANWVALELGGCLVSSYRSARGRLFWVTTEWDRSVTTVNIPVVH
jgi:hypothetical protein